MGIQIVIILRDKVVRIAVARGESVINIRDWCCPNGGLRCHELGSSEVRDSLETYSDDGQLAYVVLPLSGVCPYRPVLEVCPPIYFTYIGVYPKLLIKAGGSIGRLTIRETTTVYTSSAGGTILILFPIAIEVQALQSLARSR